MSENPPLRPRDPMTGPEVSVLLPVRDAAPTLAAALRSVARSRGVEFECLILDDGSADESPEIAARTTAEDPRFEFVRLPRTGIVPTLNAGVAMARAPLLARMDADDWMHRDRLRIQRDELRAESRWAGLGCRVRLFPRGQLGAGMRRYESWLNGIRRPEDVRCEAYVECPVAHPTLMMRREVLRRFAYRDLPWPEDYDLLLRLLAAGEQIGVSPRRLLGWRHSKNRLSKTDPRYSQAAFVACKAAFLADEFLAATETYTLWGHGPTGRSLSRALSLHGKRVRRIVEVHPRRIGQRIGGAPVISPDELPPAGESPLLCAVSGAPAREEIRGHLAKRSYVEGRDYVCAA